MTLQEAVDTGMEHNPDILAERENINISDAQIKKAGLRVNPRFTMEATISDKSYYGYLEQLFENGGKRKKRIEISKTEKNITEKELDKKALDLKYKISDAYITHYCNFLRLNLAEEIYNNTKNVLTIARKRKKIKDEITFSTVELYENNYYNDYITARNNYNKSFNELNYLTGGKLDIKNLPEKPNQEDIKKYFAETKYSVNQENVKEIINLALEQRPEIRSLETSIDKCRQQESQAKLRAIPNTLILLGSNITSAEVTRAGVYTALGIDIPIHNYGQADVKIARAQKSKYEKELSAKKLSIEKDINNICFSIIQNEKSLNLYEKDIMPKATKIIEKSKLDFEKGVHNALIFLVIQEPYVDSRKNHISAYESYEKSLNDLKYAVGANIEKL